MSAKGGVVDDALIEDDVPSREDEQYAGDERDEHPISGGRRVSRRALVAAAIILAVPGLIVARGVYGTSHQQVETRSALHNATGSTRDVQGVDYSEQQRANDRRAATETHVKLPIDGVTQTGGVGGDAGTQTGAGTGAGRAATGQRTQRTGRIARSDDPCDPAAMADATGGYDPTCNAGGTGTQQTSYNNGGGNAYQDGSQNSAVSTAQQQREARARAAAEAERAYRERLHASSTLRVDGPAGSAAVAFGSRSADATPAPAESGEPRAPSSRPDAAVAREVLEAPLHGPAGEYVLAGWQRIEIIFDDGIRASGTVAAAAGNGGGGGTAWARVLRDVWDATGRVKVIPADSRVKFVYRAPAAGDRELRGEFTRVVYPAPDLRWFSLVDPDGHGVHVGDPNGDDNLSARVDDHRRKIVRVAAATAALSAIPIAIAGQNQSLLSNANVVQSTAQQFSNRINDTANRYADAELSIPPTLGVEPGRHALVKLDRDIPVVPYTPQETRR